MFFIIKLAVFVAFIFFIYFHFLSYGEIKFISGEYEVDTTYALIAVLFLIFVVCIAYLSQIVRFIVNLPSKIVDRFRNTKREKARKILQQILFLKDSDNLLAARSLFKKNESLLASQKSSFIEITRFKLFLADLSQEQKEKILFDLSNDNENADFIYKELIIPNFLAGKINELEKFADKFTAKNLSFELTELHIKLLKREISSVEKLYKSVKSFSEFSKLSLADVQANILIVRAKEKSIIKDSKDISDLVSDAFVKSSTNKSLHQFIKSLDKKKVNLVKLSNQIETIWSSNPLSLYLHLYLLIKGDGSQGKMLDVCEALLAINNSDHAKQIIACEYLLYGYKKQAEKLLEDIDESRYLPSLVKAFIFREAISQESKFDKLETFRKIVIGSDV